MRKHPILARMMLDHIAFLQPAMSIPYYHHERWDGGGYPEGLTAENIPMAARIFAVVDHWEALNSNRPYRLAWPRDKIVAYLQANAGIIFDPKVVAAFLRLAEEQRLAE